MTRGAKGWRLAARLACALAVATLFLFPIYWLAAISIKTPEEIFAYPPVWIPSGFRLDGYVTLFRDGDAWAVWNSLVTAGISTVLAMVIGFIAAYSIVRYRTGGDHLAIWIISQRMIPPICVAFPIFLLFVSLRIVDTYTGLVMLYTAFNLPYVIWMMRGFIQEIPLELEQSALVDGLSRWAVLWKVVLPMSRAGFFATAVFTFIFAWNDFLFALILTRSDVITYPVQVTGYFGSQSTFWSKIGAMSMLGVLPMIFVVGTMQRFIVRGFSMGAVKG
ncbi:MAG: carbohydrate ABC transporter permease [Albidovulum sp.]|nr:carbohydrate ABC transporter permease [Albidovulum sp.]